MKISTFLFTIVCFLMISVSCRKDAPIPQPDVPEKDTVPAAPVDTSKTGDTTEVHHFGQAALSFQAMVGTKKLYFDTVWYKLGNGEYLTISKFNYYLSNFRLKNSDGTFYTEKESYHFIHHGQGKNNFTLKSIPTGTYVSMEFLIGVDSLRNVSGAQTGDLDVVNDMFWDWNTGYIFYKLEGEYFDGTTPDPKYSIHIGGFEGPNNCIQKISINFPAPLIITEQKTSTVLCETLVEEIFESPRQITIGQYYNELSNGPKIFQDLSINYRDMIKVTQVIN